MDPDLKEEIQIGNLVAFSGVPVCILYCILFVSMGYVDHGLYFLVGIPVFSSALFLTEFLNVDWARRVTVLLVPLFWASVTVMFGRECGFYLGFVVISFPPLLFFPSFKKAIPYVLWSISLLVASIIFLGYIDPGIGSDHAFILYMINLSVVVSTTCAVVVIFRNQIIENKLIVREQKREIIDSINYASRIQKAALPMQSLKAKLFPESFVMFLPKDIVSGDFYWFGEKDGKKIIAAVDCTGHGVPGAFMSMIGNSFLNEIVLEQGNTTPSIILDKLRSKIINTLAQDESGPSQKDGMDMALLTFDDVQGTVEFSGAKNPLYLIRNGELTETKGDKMPIGEESGAHQDFTNHKFEVESGDVYYVFTDGFPDQFGGEKGKKYKYSNFKKFLVKHHKQPMAEQEKALNEEYLAWKADFEQLDDICIIGIQK